MRKKIYKVNLRGIDIESYKLNPIVLSQWDYDNIESLIGRATIIDKTHIEVEYRLEGDMPSWQHTIGAAYTEVDGRKELTALATIPITDKTGYKCFDCGRICKSPSGLSLHMNAMHLKLSLSQVKEAERSRK